MPEEQVTELIRFIDYLRAKGTPPDDPVLRAAIELAARRAVR